MQKSAKDIQQSTFIRMNYLQFLPLLELSLSETLTQKSKLCNSVKDAMSDIINRAQLLHEAVDKTRDILLQRTKSILAVEMKRLDDHEKDLQGWILWLSSARSSVNNKERENTKKQSSVENDDHDEFAERIQRLTEIEHICLQFKYGDIVNEADMKRMFGSVENFRITPPSAVRRSRRNTFPNICLKRKARFRCVGQGGNIHAIAPISATEAWVCCGWGSKTIELYDFSGKQKTSLKLDMSIDHMVLTAKGDILISSYNGKTIQLLDEHLKVTDFASLTFIPRGMTVTDQNEVYVCGVERTGNGTKENHHDNRRHIIAKFSGDGKFISELVISPHDPHRIGIIPDDGMCFSDYGQNNKRQLVIMEKDGTVVKTYTGNDDHQLENPFYPLGTVCDQYGHIIVADWNNDRVHLLNRYGQFIQFLVDSGEGIERPSALAIDRDGQLWVGNATGCVSVYSYFSW